MEYALLRKLLPILVLQKPYAKPKAKEHSVCLKDTWKCTWLEGDLSDVLLEGRTITTINVFQNQHPKVSSQHQNSLARSFAINFNVWSQDQSCHSLINRWHKGWSASPKWQSWQQPYYHTVTVLEMFWLIRTHLISLFTLTPLLTMTICLKSTLCYSNPSMHPQ